MPVCLSNCVCMYHILCHTQTNTRTEEASVLDSTAKGGYSNLHSGARQELPNPLKVELSIIIRARE